MRIVFMGTPEFAISCLEVLIQSEHEVVAVVTQPDKPKGRGKKVQPTPVKEVAAAHDIPVYQPVKVKDAAFIEVLESLKPDLIVVVAFGQILSKEILDLPPKGCVNVHASLLPKYRGAGPLYWPVINGEKTTGVTTMYMNEGLDTGDMILKKEIPIQEQDTAGSIHDKLSILGAEVLKETIDLIQIDRAPRQEQNHDEASYAPMLSKEIGEIDWNHDSEKIRNLIRGTNPWPVAYTYLQGQKMKVYCAENYHKRYEGHEQGEVVEMIPKKGIVVATKDGSLVITEIQFEGSRKMSMDDYLRGHTIDVGVVLGTIQV